MLQCLALDLGAKWAMVYDSNALARSSRRRIMDAFVKLLIEMNILFTNIHLHKKKTYSSNRL